jgi:hypothetical protein
LLLVFGGILKCPASPSFHSSIKQLNSGGTEGKSAFLGVLNMQLCLYLYNITLLAIHFVIVTGKGINCLAGPYNVAFLMTFIKKNQLVLAQWEEDLWVKIRWCSSKSEVLVFWCLAVQLVLSQPNQ